jgi:hypothetical protein
MTIDYELLKEVLRDVCEIYDLHPSIIDAVFIIIGEKKHERIRNE